MYRQIEREVQIAGAECSSQRCGQATRPKGQHRFEVREEEPTGDSVEPTAKILVIVQRELVVRVPAGFANCELVGDRVSRGKQESAGIIELVAAEIEQLKRNWVDGRSRDGWIAGKEGVNQRLRIGRIATIGAGKNRERSGTNKGSRRKSTPLPRPLVIDEEET